MSQFLDFQRCSAENLLNFLSFFKAQVIIPSNFASISSAIKNNSSILSLAQTLFTLVKSSLWKCNFLRCLSAQVKIYQILTSILNWQVNSSSNFVSFFIVTTQNSPVNFRLIHFLLWIEGSHQSPNFYSFKHALMKIC